MKWITRADVRVDRVACPWLLRRFVDHEAEFLFVPEADFLATADREHATAFDAPRLSQVKLNHRGERCTFEAIVDDCGLAGPPLRRLGEIVRAADFGPLNEGDAVVRRGTDEIRDGSKLSAHPAKTS